METKQSLIGSKRQDCAVMVLVGWCRIEGRCCPRGADKEKRDESPSELDGTNARGDAIFFFHHFFELKLKVECILHAHNRTHVVDRIIIIW